MNIAFLFNSDHHSFCGYYGPPIMNLILGTEVLQDADRNMRLSVGDILTYSTASRSPTPTFEFHNKLCRAVYVPFGFDRLIKNRLEATFDCATVYCWLFQNMTEGIALQLDNCLIGCEGYLGSMDVNFSHPLHLLLFRNSLIEAYRLRRRQCSVFYNMGTNEDPDIVIRECFETHGFSVKYEDSGARRTIFDNYDTLEHFNRVESFKSFFAKLPELDCDSSCDIAHSLEELHPKLFDGFAAAARTFDRAETEEDLAQAALSGRRLLEQTADYLFPPQDTEWKGRKVGKPQYKNRLWAYVENTAITAGINDQNLINRLGSEADRLVELFNAGLHADPTREKIELAFRDLIIWLSELIYLDPESATKPYLAYEREIQEILTSVQESDVHELKVFRIELKPLEK